MGKNLAFRIKVEIVETGAAPSLDRCPQEHEDGSFNGVVPESDELNISALREVLSRYLTEAGKKTPSAS
jgi:hypothetical protein